MYMKNKSFYLTLLLLSALVFTSCAGSRSGYGRKGYGCPQTAFAKPLPAEKPSI